MLLPVLVLAVQMQSSDDPATIARRVQRAVEGDSLPAVIAPWQRRLARQPDDRAASFAVGLEAVFTYDYDRAEREFGRVVSLSRGTPDRLTAYARLGIGTAHHLRSRFAAADANFEAARADARAVKAADVEAEVLIALAQVRLRTAGAPLAKALLDTAAIRTATLATSPRRQMLNALRTCAAAYVHVRLATPGVRDTAVRGAALAKQAGEPRIRAACLFMIAQELERQGKFDSAFTMMRGEVEPILLKAHHRHGLGTLLQWSGYLAFRLGSYGYARRQLQQAVQHSEASGNGSALSWAHNGLAQVAADIGDNVTATTELTRARELLIAQGDRWGLATVRGLQAEVAQARGAVDEARTANREAIDSLVAIGNTYSAIERYRALAVLEQEEKRWDAADRWLRAADTIARGRVAPGWLAERPVHEAANALGRGQLEAADSILSRVVTDAPAELFEFASRHAEVLARRNDLDGAERRLADAAEAFTQWRRQQGSEREFRVALIQSRKTFGLSAAGVPFAIGALARGGRIARAFAFAEQRRARELLGRIAAREVPTDMRTGRSQESAAAAPPVATLDEVTHALPRDVALVEYLSGRPDEPVTAFVITRDGASVLALASSDSLFGLARRLTMLMSSGTVADELARRLGDAAVSPIVARLPAHVTKLVIVADGVVHRVPFEALRTSDGRWLMERFAVTSVPSATTLVRLMGNAAARAQTAEPMLVAFGDPAYERAARPTAGAGGDGELRVSFASAGALTRLPYSAREVRSIARYFPRADIRLGRDATEASLHAAGLGRASVLHFATHALVDDQVTWRSALALAPGAGYDGFVTGSEIAALSLNAELVVLSGCRTAQGALVVGEGVQGLTAPLLEAGARSVLATRWPVGDREASAMVVSFYDAMARGNTAGDALRVASRAAIARGTPASEWAAFALVGDPTVRLELRRVTR
jgi:CHAT domain-containing protein/tetratricopeptide (TPR) repeat protein